MGEARERRLTGCCTRRFWGILNNSVAVVAVASPLAEGERIEVRGFSSAVELKWPTLTLPSPLVTERRATFAPTDAPSNIGYSQLQF
jgi:hypothetical protein